MRYDTVIFDLDGTLLDTLDDLWVSGCYMMAQLGEAPLKREQVRSYVGNGMDNYVARALSGGRSHPRFSEAVDIIKAHYDAHNQIKTAPYPGVLEMIGRLKDLGLSVAVVSNKPHSAVVPLVADYFHGSIPCAIGQQEGIHRKPAPDMVNRALELLGKGRESALYVGDSEVDVQTAHNAGMDCLSVTWGFRDRNQLEEAGAAHYADTPEQVVEFVLHDSAE